MKNLWVFNKQITSLKFKLKLINFVKSCWRKMSVPIKTITKRSW